MYNKDNKVYYEWKDYAKDMKSTDWLKFDHVIGIYRGSLLMASHISNMRDVSMADAEQVKNQTGFSIGGVSPIGHMKKINILIDKSLSRFEYVYAAAGHPNCVFEINFENLTKITSGKVIDVVE